MRLTAIISILTITRDDLPSGDLCRWTQAVSVAAAVARKQHSGSPQGITEILMKTGWVMQSVSELPVELSDVYRALSTPRIPLLDSFLDLVRGSTVPIDVASLLDWWWTNACTVEGGPIACIAVLDGSGGETAVDLRAVSLPTPAWSWLARMPSLQASIMRIQMVVNPSVYAQIAKTLKEKSEGLTDHVRSVTIALDSNDG